MRTFLEQEIGLINSVIVAMTREIARSDDDPRTRFDELKAAVLRDPEVLGWRERFVGKEEPDARDFFDGYALPGLIEALHAEMWPR